MTILFVRGCGDDGVGKLRGVSVKGQLVWTVIGCCEVQQYLGLEQGAYETIMMFGKKLKQPPANFHIAPSLVFNQISDPDVQSGALSRCAELCEQLSVPVINRPEQILKTSRDEVSRLLEGIPGVIIPATYRANPASPDEVFDLVSELGLDYPVILRPAGDHGGHNMTVINGREDYDKLHAHPFDGRDFYLIEFVDYRNSQGVYVKTRIAVIDGQPTIRHGFFNDTWKVHGASEKFMEQNPQINSFHGLIRDGEAMLPRIGPAIREIHRRLGLDYFGIDCHINDEGEMLIFEANASMNFFKDPNNYYQSQLASIRSQIKAMISRRSGEKIR